jgi:hypothetical protein
MALDYISAVTGGAYATPGTTTTQRAVYFVSWGLLSIAGAVSLVVPSKKSWLLFFKQRKK